MIHYATPTPDVALCGARGRAMRVTIVALDVDCHWCIQMMDQLGIGSGMQSDQPTEILAAQPETRTNDGYKMLDLNREDPFDAAIIEIVETNHRKRADYALDGDIFSNFREAAESVGVDGFGPVEAVLFHIGNKMSRLRALRRNGRMNNPNYEGVEDTYRDLAVYSVILMALSREEAEK